MPQQGDGQGGSLSKVVVSAVTLVAAFIILRFVIGAAMSVLKWVFIAGALLALVWLFSRDSGSGSSSG